MNVLCKQKCTEIFLRIFFLVVVFPEMQLSDSDSDWLTLNFNVTGYYRVNYDELGWKKLNQQLEKDPKVWLVLVF